MVGFGKVPRDTISTEIIIVIIVALGIPVGLILLGAVYVTYKKKPWQNVARGIHRCASFIIKRGSCHCSQLFYIPLQ